MLNEVKLIGRLVQDPTVFTNEAGEISKGYISIAVDRNQAKGSSERTADFPSIVLFGKTAELAQKYLKKGRRILVEGVIRTGKFTDKNNEIQYTQDIVANRITFLDSGFGEKKESNVETKAAEPATEAASASTEAPVNTASDGFMNIPSDDEEPFPFN